MWVLCRSWLPAPRQWEQLVDLYQSLCIELFQRFPQCYAADPPALAEYFMGRQPVTGVEFSIEYVLMDLVGDNLTEIDSRYLLHDSTSIHAPR